MRFEWAPSVKFGRISSGLKAVVEAGFGVMQCNDTKWRDNKLNAIMLSKWALTQASIELIGTENGTLNYWVSEFLTRPIRPLQF